MRVGVTVVYRDHLLFSDFLGFLLHFKLNGLSLRLTKQKDDLSWGVLPIKRVRKDAGP